MIAHHDLIETACKLALAAFNAESREARRASVVFVALRPKSRG